eukprot:Tamp_12421.p1 GENE.Tamp_12421~~Tamp_12421.p1  ORF type:complete len:274 (+),score=45.34 Tamp_12421:778-1599(+)
MKTEDEECDDGNDSDDDGCSNCTIVVTTEYKKEWACGSSPMNLTAKLEASGKGKQTHIDDEESQTEPPPSPPGQEGNGKWIWTEGRRAASSNSTESDATNSTESDTESNPLPVCNVSECRLMTIPEPGNSPEDVANAKALGGLASKIALGTIALAAVSGAAAGPVMIMVDQMQYMSVIGRVGGGTSAATRAFSEEFAIFNFDILPNVFDKKPAKNPLARRHRQVLRRGELENSTSDSRRQDEDGGEDPAMDLNEDTDFGTNLTLIRTGNAVVK